MTSSDVHVVVTGVGGFIGARLACRIAATGARVTGFYRQTPPPAAVTQASHALVREDLARLIAIPPCDVLVHAAATSRLDPARHGNFELDNVVATERLLDAALAAGCRRVVLLSSLSVYGHITAPEVDETTAMVDADPYGRSKRQAEIALEQRSESLTGLAIRLPGVVGRGADRHWLSGVAERLLRREPVHVYHPAAPFNNAIHVSALADFVTDAIHREWRDRIDHVVVGAGGSTTVQGAVERLARGLGVDPIIVPVAASKTSFVLSSRRAIDRWGYRPEDIGSVLDRYAHDLRSQGADDGRATSPV